MGLRYFERRNKIVLQMYPVTYHGESQLPCTNFAFDDDGSDLDENEDTSYGDEQFGPIQSYSCKTGAIYQCGGPGEYLIHQDDTDNFDCAIARWMNNYAIYQISAMEPELDNIDLLEFVTGSELDEPLCTPELIDPVCQEINLGTKDHPQSVKVYDGIQGQELQNWTEFIRKHKSAFAWTYADLGGIPAEIAEHRIVLEEDARPIWQRQHRLNQKYSLMVKEELDKLLRVGFIYVVSYSEWVSPIVMVPKNNGKIRIYQDYRKLNAVKKKDYFPLPFTDSILDAVAGHESYSFLDGFSSYNQVKIAKEDQLKNTFTTDWATYAYTVMPFGLCNAPATFQRVMTQAFQKYLRISMENFLNDLCMFSSRKEHLD